MGKEATKAWRAEDSSSIKEITCDIKHDAILSDERSPASDPGKDIKSSSRSLSHD